MQRFFGSELLVADFNQGACALNAAVMATDSAPSVPEPFPIFKLAHKHLIYDADTVAHVRREHNICGVFIGGLPQAPQQNVFLGLPLELMPEEARLLVEKGVAYVVDDVKAHKEGFLGAGLSAEERRAFQAALSRRGVVAAKKQGERSDERKKAALSKKLGTENWNDIPEDMLGPSAERGKKRKAKGRDRGTATPTSTADEDESLFATPMNSFPSQSAESSTPQTPDAGPDPFLITPTTSYPPLPPPARSPQHAPSHSPTMETPSSYPLFKHLHGEGYFLAPGLRFGCQYMAYPGDPLRFHSHFLCNGMDWDQEFDLLDLVAGGRLGTGVKKGFLIGGKEERESGDAGAGKDDEGGVRPFCVEWGGM